MQFRVEGSNSPVVVLHEEFLTPVLQLIQVPTIRKRLVVNDKDLGPLTVTPEAVISMSVDGESWYPVSREEAVEWLSLGEMPSPEFASGIE